MVQGWDTSADEKVRVVGRLVELFKRPDMSPKELALCAEAILKADDRAEKKLLNQLKIQQLQQQLSKPSQSPNIYVGVQVNGSNGGRVDADGRPVGDDGQPLRIEQSPAESIAELQSLLESVGEETAGAGRAGESVPARDEGPLHRLLAEPMDDDARAG